MRTQIQAVLFDLDGTLIDSEAVAAKAMQEAFTNWQIQLQPEDASYVSGRTWQSAFDHLMSRYEIPISKDELRERIMERYRTLLAESLPVVPGGATAVEALAKDYTLALVSGSGRREILWALDQLQIRHHFKVILGCEDYPNSKPQPDGYLKAIEMLGVSPACCLIFEDSVAGIQSAKAAGVRVVAVTSTNHFNQDLSHADSHIPDLRQVDAAWIRHLSFD